MGFLRLLLALSVIIAHSEPFLGLKLVGGSQAVELFFVISGFYMAMILSKKYTGKGSYAIFIQNRFLKIYPMYIASIFIIICMSLAIYLKSGSLGKLEVYSQYGDGINLYSYLFLFISNVLIFGQDVVMFLGIDINTGSLFFTPDFRQTSPSLYKFLLNPPAWSIAVELTFYLIAPFILRRKIKVIIGIAFISLLVKYYIIFHLGLKNDPWTYRFFPSELYYFLIGSLSYRISSLYLDRIDHKLKVNLGYIMLILNVIFIIFNERLNIGFSIFVVLFSITIPFIFIAFKESKLDRDIGELSYPVYILHYPMLAVASKLCIFFSIDYLRSEVTMLITVVISFVFIRLLMDPLDEYRQNKAMKLITV
jgi:peptidoglycan/LPS O-acetylase OafA/YrhL